MRENLIDGSRAVFAVVAVFAVALGVCVACTLATPVTALGAECTITYNLNEGKCIEGFELPTSYWEGKTEVDLPTSDDIVRSGYVFAGWYRSEDFSGDAVTRVSRSSTGDLTFYAKWNEARTLKITILDVVEPVSMVYPSGTYYNQVKANADGTYSIDKVSTYRVSAYSKKGWYDYKQLTVEPGDKDVELTTTLTRWIGAVEIADIPAQTYTGSAVKPKLQVTFPGDGSTLVEGVDYKATYSNCINASEYASVTVTGIGKYSGNFDEEYTIKPAELGRVKLGKSKLVYTGSLLSPGTLVYNKAGEWLQEGSCYIGYRQNCTNIGRGTVKIVGVGNYTGIKYLYLDIVPAKGKVKSVKQAGRKKATVKVAKPAGGASSQLSYRTKLGKWKTVNLGKKTKKTVKGLKKGKKLQVKVRSYKKVGGKTYYGSWSKTKLLKVK